MKSRTVISRCFICQAEDGIRDGTVTGVQTCALPIYGNLVNAGAIRRRLEEAGSLFQTSLDTEVFLHLLAQAEGDFEERLLAACREVQGAYRSEERRVGKECRCRVSAFHEK